MAFVTKKYTRPVIASNLRNVSAANFRNLTTLARALSPRAGVRSAQVAALRSIIGVAALNSVFSSYSGNTSSIKRSLINSVLNS